MYIVATEKKTWKCERCCTRDGDRLRVTWWYAEADVEFSMVDAFTNPYPTGWGVGDPFFPAYQQGKCVQECVKVYGTEGAGINDCIEACRKKYPTNGDAYGIPFGIFHNFSRNAFESKSTPCGSEFP
jgi:hypothetical protein